MVASSTMTSRSASSMMSLLRSLLLATIMFRFAQAQEKQYVTGMDAQGVTRQLLDSRDPALYTGDFGDCLGGQSLLNVTLFDAAYYADNMTVLFHVGGQTNLRSETVMMYISVFAYGENRFDLVFNPCNANFGSLCPMDADTPVSGVAVIPVSRTDVSGIPDIALRIPDFEGSATLRIFSNSTRSEIGCYQAVMTNGASFSHVAAVGSVLGIFTLIALFASFATAVYGADIPAVRTHYAHSMSVLIVFEVFQYVFFSGALSLNWPSVLPAFWSNFAWSAGQIYTSSVINSINRFTGVLGNSSQVGNAGSNIINNNGGLQQQIYGRSARRSLPEGLERGNALISRIYKRADDDIFKPTGYSWAGAVEHPGLPIPGNWSKFAGTLSDVEVPAANAFLVGFVWFLILMLMLVTVTAAFKWSLEALNSRKWIKEDFLKTFRNHWVHYVALILLRSALIAFFMMMSLTLFQFSYGGNAGPIAIAVIVFLLFFVGILGAAFYACYYRLQFGRYASSPDRIHFQRKKVLRYIPWYSTARESSLDEEEKVNSAASISFFRLHFDEDDTGRGTIHQDEQYIKRFGWLSSRFRRTRWWFFAVWIVYQFVRAAFVGGARASPTAQVIGLFIVEIIAFIGIIYIKPFESTRNTAMAVYMLSLSKVMTSGLSIAFLSQLNVARISTTVIGVVIIVIQGFLVIALLILIVLGAISSYMSLTRNREDFRPRRWQGMRLKYFNNLEKRARDVPPPPPPPPEEPREPYFSVKSVYRAPKIEDEDVITDMPELPMASQMSLPMSRTSRANSISSSNIPFGARVHRASWSSRDFQTMRELEEDRASPPIATASRDVNGQNTARSSYARPMAFHAAQSVNTSRPSTPTTPRRGTLEQHAAERFQH